MEEFKTTIGQRLACLRAESRLSLDALADLIGYSPDAVRSWESGERVPSAYAVYCIAQRLYISADWLLGLSG